MRFGSFTYLLKQGAKNTYLNKAMSAASVGVLTACLVIVGFSILVSENIKSIVGFVQQQNEIIVFVEDNIPSSVEATLERQIRSMDNVAEVSYTSKEQAFQNQSEKLGDLLEGYENEDIFPASYHIKIKDISRIEENVEIISSLDGVESVDAPTNVAQVMVKTERGISVACSVVVIALLIGSLVIIMNTIKITVYNRRREINIMKYVGAKNGFIRMPFLVEGMILGFSAALAAFIIVWSLYERLYMGIESDANSWINSLTSSLIPFENVIWKLVSAYLVTGVAIGGFGSLISIRKHLKV
ncbi:MAG: ABC transporter permease [Ruminococcaceae bacterium]|nr:ABC transporter permease [Oscillospiraceae bacterium]